MKEEDREEEGKGRKREMRKGNTEMEKMELNAMKRARPRMEERGGKICGRGKHLS